MTTGQTVSDFIKLSREAILAKDFVLAETYKQQAVAIKGLDDLTPRADPSKRLDFGDGTDPAAIERTASGAAMKAWYTKTYGADIDTDVETVLADLYGGDYRHLRWAKTADFTRWVRTGRCDPKLEKLVVYTPEQVLAEIATGMSVAELKATQVESQDTSGKVLAA